LHALLVVCPQTCALAYACASVLLRTCLHIPALSDMHVSTRQLEHTHSRCPPPWLHRPSPAQNVQGQSQGNVQPSLLLGAQKGTFASASGLVHARTQRHKGPRVRVRNGFVWHNVLGNSGATTRYTRTQGGTSAKCRTNPQFIL